MIPRIAIHYSRHARTGDVKSAGNRRLILPILEAIPNLPNLLFVYLCKWMAFTFRLPPFCAFVSHIIGASSKEQMRRISAKRNVAFVENAKPVWDWTIKNNPSYAVGASLQFSGRNPKAVSVIGCAIPKPAAFRAEFSKVFPKSFYVRRCRIDFKRLARDYFLKFIHTYFMVEFSEGRRLQPAVFAL